MPFHWECSEWIWPAEKGHLCYRWLKQVMAALRAAGDQLVPRMAEGCVSLGATAAINYREEDYVARVKELQGGRGVDVVLDMVGGDYLAKNLSLLNRRGRHVSIAFLRGSKVPEGFDFGRLLVNNLTLSASTLRPRAVSRTIRSDHRRCLLPFRGCVSRQRSRAMIVRTGGGEGGHRIGAAI